MQCDATQYNVMRSVHLIYLRKKKKRKKVLQYSPVRPKIKSGLVWSVLFYYQLRNDFEKKIKVQKFQVQVGSGGRGGGGLFVYFGIIIYLYTIT